MNSANNYKISTILLGSIFTLLSGCTATTSDPLNTAQRSTSAPVITIGGSSETYEVLERLAAAYKVNNKTEFEFFPPSQSSSGIAGVKSDLLDIGGVSTLPSEAEQKAGLTYVPLTATPLVMVVHESVVGVTDISAEQLKAVYKGDLTDWQALGGPNTEIVLFDVSEDESEKKLLRKTYLGTELEITADAIAFAEDDEMLDTAAETDFSIAAVPFEDELEALPITILSIDGVLPSPENIESGAYPMALPLGLTVSETPSEETASFLSFVMSEEGQALLSD